MELNKVHLEYIRDQAKRKFDRVKGTWMDVGTWTAPHRVQWMQSQLLPGARVNRHIVDMTHVLARRSYVAGFLEGNTSASRPWFRIMSQDREANQVSENRGWLQIYSERCHAVLSRSNFYNAAAQFYDDYGNFNNGTHFIEEIDDDLFFHTLEPGSYYLINDSRGEAVVLVREFQLNVRALVEMYGKKGDWSNFSYGVKKMYEDGNYGEMIDVVTISMKNKDFNPSDAQTTYNRQWMTVTYEGGANRQSFAGDGTVEFGIGALEKDAEKSKYLNIVTSKRKPFIAGRSNGGIQEYGMSGPSYDAIGLIKSLNKKAVGKDRALEQMLSPAMQGPASLRKSYISNAAGTYIPLDAQSLAATQGKGLRSIFEVNPAITALVEDTTDLRSQVEKLYYADYLLYLSRNPKTRTATETNAVLSEQQLIIGPNLQSLNWTYNVPLVEFVMSFVLDKDPHLPDMPPGLAGKFVQTEFISVFAQAQKAADLPAIERYMQMITGTVAADPSGHAAKLWDKVNIDKLADLFADRLFLPEGLNNPQAKVDADRQQAQAMAQKQQLMNETIPAMAGAAKDIGIQAPQQQGA